MTDAAEPDDREPAVLSAGTVNADFTFGVDAQLEPGASLVARRLLRTSGGRAANVAVMARRPPVNVDAATRVGLCPAVPGLST